MTRSIGRWLVRPTVRSIALAAAALAVLLGAHAPARANGLEAEPAVAPESESGVPPASEPGADTAEDLQGEAVAPDAEPVREPYLYPSGPEEPDRYPDGWVRVPAAAVDLLLVRPAMVVGLGAGAVAFVVTLPFTAPTLTTDDAAHALFDQTLAALARPLGEF